ncbi:MAG TPA: hypothetical protein VIM86_05140 [Thermodesulfobacteriota bacterium]
MEPARLGIKAYARHRAALGLPGGTPAAVRKAIARGQIQAGPDGLIDVAAADAAWPGDRVAAASGRGISGVTRKGEPVPPSGRPTDPAGEPAGEEVISYAEARRRKEVALARRRELEVAQLEGELIPLSMHRERLERIVGRLAGRLKNIPGAWTPRLGACETDTDRLATLKTLVNELLEELLREADRIEQQADAGEDEDASD